MKITSYIAIVTLISIADDLSAQDFKQTMEKLRDKYQSAENLRIKMSVEVFETQGKQRSFYHEKITITKHGTSYHHHVAGTDMVMNDKYLVLVDRPTKKIIVNKRDVKAEAKFYKKAPFNMDSILQAYDGGKFDGAMKGMNKFSATQKIGPIAKIELFMDQVSGDLKQVNYSYRAGQWATIIFEELDLSPTFDVNEFNEQQFIHKSGKTWQPSTAFAGYEVVRADDAKAFVNN
ncbi:MAG: hypothetical protein WDO15_29355 [Bacteroidota bacterium]